MTVISVTNLFKQPNSIIGFYHENEDYGCFSNWYPAGFEYAGKHFAHVEQFMMYHKTMMFKQYEKANRIMATTDPGECKRIGREHFPEFDSGIWENTCRRIVKRGVRAKFVQNEQLLSELER